MKSNSLALTRLKSASFTILLPFSLFCFFLIATPWFNGIVFDSTVEQISKSNLPEDQKLQEIRAFSNLDMASMCTNASGAAKLESYCTRLSRINLATNLSFVLLTCLLIILVTLHLLNRMARKSKHHLIWAYKTGWSIGLTTSFFKILLQGPLLAYALFEFTVLLSNRYYPKLILAIVIGAGFALFASFRILFRKVSMEFGENFAREAKESEAPELWKAVRQASEKLNTQPPDHLIIGMTPGFYVTELGVRHNTGLSVGKTLYLSHPLMKHLSTDEVLAVIGHELGHFIGEDTRLSRDFYPLKHKVYSTMASLHQSGLVGLSSFHLLNYFYISFSEIEQSASRERELLADQVGARLVNNVSTAKALIKTHIYSAAERISFFERTKVETTPSLPTELPRPEPVASLVQIVHEKLLPDSQFWEDLLLQNQAHPLDSHPTLKVRLEALEQKTSVEDIKKIAQEESAPSAFETWFSGRSDFFENLEKQSQAADLEVQSEVLIKTSDYETVAGKALLDKLYPPRTFKTSSLYVIFLLSMAIVGVGICAGLIFVVHALVLKGLFLLSTVLLLRVLKATYLNQFHAEMTLDAGGITHSSWVKKLEFKDVANLSSRAHHWSVSLTLALRTPSPRFWRYPILPIAKNHESIALECFEGKADALSELIFRYYVREIDHRDEIDHCFLTFAKK